MNKFDVVILGSGISSLVAATILSKQGKSVVVLEQYNKFGGYMHCFERKGHRFDTGAHYVGALEEGQSFWALLNYLGVYDPNVFVPLDPQGFDIFHFPERTISIPKGYKNVVARLSEHFPSEKNAIAQFFSLVQEAARYFPTYFYSDTPEIEMSLRFLKVSLAQVVEDLTAHPELKSVLYGYCSLHGVIPQDVAFGLHALMMDSFITGSYGFTKGGEALVDRFVEKIEEQGGKVLANRRVTQLKVVDRNIREVVTDKGEIFTGEWVISGIHPKSTFGLLDSSEALTPAFQDRLNGMSESVGLFGVYLVCENPPAINPLSNFYFFDQSNPQTFMQSRTHKDLPGIVFASPADRTSHAPRSVPLNFHAAAPMDWFSDWKTSRMGRRPPQYVERKDLFAESVLSLAERYYPGLKASVRFQQSSSPLTNLFFNGSVDGSAFGIYHSMENTGVRALGPRTKVLNLLLTGQNTLFPGLIGAASSGLRSSAHLVGMKPLVREIQRYFRPEAHQ